MNVFELKMSVTDVNKISMLGLAHIGDCVYELMVRSMLCLNGDKSVSQLHRDTVSLVNANFQAAASKKIADVLTEDEAAVFRRGRNAKVNSIPHNSTIGDYHLATAVEALFGWLYLQGRTARLEELFAMMMEE